jgi:hypothetical protein
MKQEDLEAIAEALKKRGADKECPRCGKDKFVLVDRIEIDLSASNRGALSSLTSPRTIPTALIGCENCGYLMQHALGLLGFPTHFGRT